MANGDVVPASKNKIPFALIISIASILFTFFNFYYFNLRIKNKLHAKIVEYSLNQNPITKKSDTIAITISFTNIGNRQCMVSQPWYEMADANKSVLKTSILLSKTNFPAVVLPNEIKSMNFRIPLRDLTAQEMVIDTLSSEKKTAIFRVKLIGLDFNFVQHTAFSEFVLQITFTGNDILSIREYSNKPLENYPVINLIS